MTAPSFLIVDDHPLFLEALKSTLTTGYPDARVDVADGLTAARLLLDRAQYDLVLLDLRLPDANGFDGLRDVRAKAKSSAVAVLSALQSSDIITQAKSGGASGFIHKSENSQGLLALVARLLKGESVFPEIEASEAKASQDNLVDRLRQLTPQQLKVLQRVCEAKLNKQIAFELGVTETTIKAHITLIFKKLGVHSRTQTVLQLQRMKSDLEDSEFAMLLEATA
jgi:DNA-binding NarL/FixJ family response regulator